MGHINEALAYLRHPILGLRLRELSDVILGCDTQDIIDIMGNPPNARVIQASMTLWKWVANDELTAGRPHPIDPVFNAVLAKYFNGKEDVPTVEFLKGMWHLPRVHEVVEEQPPPPPKENRMRRFLRAMRKKCGWTRLKEKFRSRAGGARAVLESDETEVRMD
jgi:hypothetical protein